ncbi:MAG: hypothetical protein LH618_16685 [Saprospiraceae bacterium]|nr:hypothetical protein [Saprospiraceae bacterium]
MKESRISKIVVIAHDIKHFDNMLLGTKTSADPINEIMRFQFQHSKEQLFKELMAELVLSGIGFREIAGFLAKLTTYLSDHDTEGEPLSPVLKASLQEVERLVGAA